MKRIAATTITCLIGISTGGLPAQTPPTDSGPATSSATPAAVPVPTGFQPGLADLMTMLVQPRHLRIYYAGTEKYWELAEFEVRELRSSFRRISDAIPRYQGIDVKATVASMVVPSMHDLEVAIRAADQKQFTKAYQTLTDACNACHVYLEHPFLVIKVPDSATPGYSDQNFRPSP
jgi:hypothetical protein